MAYRFVEFDLGTGVFGDIFGEIFEQQESEPLIENLLEFDFARLFQVFLHYASNAEIFIRS